LPKDPEKKRNHPLASYLVGSVFIVLSAVVFVGIVHHLTLSSHGPQLLKPVLEMYLERDKSEILAEARRQQSLKIHRIFHQDTDVPQLPETMRPTCYICHSDFPHSKNRGIRSLLNMHTQFFVCEACHVEEPEKGEILYKWYSPKEAEPTGPFFGTRYDPETGGLAPVEDRFSKMAPFFKTGDELESAIQTQDAPLAKDFMRVRDRLTPEQRDGIKNKFHEHIKPKGYPCKACHVPDGILDLKALGFAEKRAADLRNLKIKSVLTNAEEVDLTTLYKE